MCLISLSNIPAKKLITNSPGLTLTNQNLSSGFKKILTPIKNFIIERDRVTKGFLSKKHRAVEDDNPRVNCQTASSPSQTRGTESRSGNVQRKQHYGKCNDSDLDFQ